MVCTRSRTVAETSTPTIAAGHDVGQAEEKGHDVGHAEDKGEGSIYWFCESQGLNGYGAIPGTDLTDHHCSKAEYIAFWGKKNYHNGSRYKKRVSPRMVRRIRAHYQKVFQRPVGASDAIPYHFGRGLLAERKGHPINWAAYARKMTHRGTGDTAHLGGKAHQPRQLRRAGKPFVFVSMVDLKKNTRPEDWPANEVGSESDGEDGSESDWKVNVQWRPEQSSGGRLEKVDQNRGENVVVNIEEAAKYNEDKDEDVKEEADMLQPPLPEQVTSDGDGRVGIPCKCCGKRRREVENPSGDEGGPIEDTFNRHCVQDDLVWKVKSEEDLEDVKPYLRKEKKGNPSQDPPADDVHIEREHHSALQSEAPLVGDNAEKTWKSRWTWTGIPFSGNGTGPGNLRQYRTGAGEGGASGVTQEACNEYVNLKIRRGRVVEQEKLERVRKMETELELDVAAFKLQEFRVELAKRQYEMEVDISRHIKRKSTVAPRTGEMREDERNALFRKVEAEEVCVDLFESNRAKAMKIQQLKMELATLVRTVTMWSTGFEAHAGRLFRELQRENTTGVSAFQHAGLDCHCSYSDCDFPFNITDSHRHL